MSLPALPGARELHDLVRRSAPRHGNVPPEAFTVAQERITDAEEALALERDGMRELIRDAYGLGVPVSTLARWSGYTARWVTVVLAGDESPGLERR